MRAFVAERSEFPTYAELDAANRADLRSAVAELGGVEYWAERLGFTVARARQRTPYRDEDALRDARAAIARANGRLPGERVLRRMGYEQLATRVRQAGGARKFAAANNLRGPERDTEPRPKP